MGEGRVVVVVVVVACADAVAVAAVVSRCCLEGGWRKGG